MGLPLRSKSRRTRRTLRQPDLKMRRHGICHTQKSRILKNFGFPSVIFPHFFNVRSLRLTIYFNKIWPMNHENVPMKLHSCCPRTGICCVCGIAWFWKKPRATHRNGQCHMKLLSLKNPRKPCCALQNNWVHLLNYFWYMIHGPHY